MKVFALGGYGKVGLAAIKLLSKYDLVSEIAIAGRNQELAEKAAEAIGKKGFSVYADGTDDQKLTSLLEDCDIIMNAAVNKTVTPAIRAAIRTGTHYCDANTVIEPALQLAPDAEAAGITAIIGSGGGAPCISNLMGVHAARQLDEVEQLQSGWSLVFDRGRELTPRLWLETPEQSLAVLHGFRPFFRWMLGYVTEKRIRSALDYKDGRFADSDSMRVGVDVPTTQGGTIALRPYYSGEQLFPGLPRNLAAKPPVEMYFSPLPPQLHELLRQHSLRVLEGEIDSDTAVDSFYGTVENDPRRWLTLPDDFVAPPEIWVRAVGRKEGREARCTCWLQLTPGRLWLLTSVALAAAVLKVLRGEVQKRGVMTAEATFEPLPFFNELVGMLPEGTADRGLIGESFEWFE